MRWYVRLPLKWLVFAAVLVLVCFPNPAQLSRHLSHLRDLDAMIDPSAPELVAWESAFRAALPERWQAHVDAQTPLPVAPPAAFVQAEIERFVYDKVPYAWDWEVWNAADYLPTVRELFDKAERDFDGVVREDCDGQALIAASLMARMGYAPRLVTDLRHVWVETPEGAWMGPGRQATIVSTETGNALDWSTIASNVPVSLSYGIAVFPLVRELIILAAAFVLALHRGLAWRTVIVCAILLLQGLLFMRLGYFAPAAVSGQAAAWPAWVGVLHIAVGYGWLLRASMQARRKTAPRRVL